MQRMEPCDLICEGWSQEEPSYPHIIVSISLCLHRPGISRRVVVSICSMKGAAVYVVIIPVSVITVGLINMSHLFTIYIHHCVLLSMFSFFPLEHFHILPQLGSFHLYSIVI